MNTSEAWSKLLEKYNIVEEVQKHGVFHIKADQIKEFKEPRLMSKWDSSSQLPQPLKSNKINILPDSRGSYIIGDFLLYEDIPLDISNESVLQYMQVPDLETVDINNISSEANAINVLVLTKILDDFLSTDENLATFNGRMGTGVFEFDVDTVRKRKQHISVTNAQCEIDGGFENNESIVILEAKNVLHEDFHIRQLYYPYRLWASKATKPIRLVFSIYSNKIFRLFEYKFENINDYSSIKLVQTKNYSLEDTSITFDDLLKVKKETIIKYNDNQTTYKTPFIQADTFERVISLLENMYNNPMTDADIADLMHFGVDYNTGRPQYRQSQYYYNAGKYLGLFEKIRINDVIHTRLTSLGMQVFKMSYKQRQLKLVSLMLEHQIFNEMFDIIINTKQLPDREIVKNRMRELNVCNEGQIHRRSSSVLGWLYWIMTLVK